MKKVILQECLWYIIEYFINKNSHVSKNMGHDLSKKYGKEIDKFYVAMKLIFKYFIDEPNNQRIKRVISWLEDGIVFNPQPDDINRDLIWNLYYSLLEFKDESRTESTCDSIMA